SAELSAGTNRRETVDVAKATGTEVPAWARFRALATRCSLAATPSTYHRFRTRCANMTDAKMEMLG
ncbi:MAG TPA: hypothetical protein VF951_12615, partial [Streptosporangiaceae bacterium]